MIQRLMLRESVDCQDMLGMPHIKGSMDMHSGALDCAGVCAEVLRRGLGDDARESFLRLFAGEEDERHKWVDLIGEFEPKCADIVVSLSGEAGLHVSAVTSLRPMFVHSSAAKLGVFSCRLEAIKSVVNVTRYIGDR